MKIKMLALLFGGLGLAMSLYPVERAMAQEKNLFIPDKALCAKMLRFGKEAYQRGKFLDAKEYFRKAVQADPTSSVAWKYYDQAVIFALAEKVEKDSDLILPGVSSHPPPPPSKPAPAKKGTEFKIMEDEGC